MHATILSFFKNPALDFDVLALEVFAYQYKHNAVYRSYCNLLGKSPKNVETLVQIPFLPIRFFKSHRVVCSEAAEAYVFYSSGTTGVEKSAHYVLDLDIYRKSYLHGFQLFYGSAEKYTILALLPSYLEQGHSSLVFMVDGLIKESKSSLSRFCLDDVESLKDIILEMEKSNRKTLLIGVSYALLDLAEHFRANLKNTIVMETGGMKGRRREIVREELHRRLSGCFGVEHIHSEYGMTELLSQAYASAQGRFKCPHWMRVYIREKEDPLSVVNARHTGCLNVIDLANINSCAFIATEDIGRLYSDYTFEVLGRSDDAEIRGCNLLISNDI